MDKYKFFQVLKLIGMAILLCIIPLLSTPLRPPFIYFIVNLLIIALGAEAGLLSFILRKTEPADKKFSTATVSVSANTNVATDQKPLLVSSDGSDGKKGNPSDSATGTRNLEAETTAKKQPNAVEKSSSEKIVAHVKVLKKSPSMPSLFFIGGGGGSDYQSYDDHQVEELDQFTEEEECADDYKEETGDHEIGGQELFHKAETFIGNFYSQLKMQREDSWNKLHELYQKAF